MTLQEKLEMFEKLLDLSVYEYSFQTYLNCKTIFIEKKLNDINNSILFQNCISVI